MEYFQEWVSSIVVSFTISVRVGVAWYYWDSGTIIVIGIIAFLFYYLGVGICTSVCFHE